MPADSFAKEATAALHEAADQMPQAAATQLNGKQLKALKKKQKAQNARATKKQKKSKQDGSKNVPAANGNADVHSTTDALANGHGGDVPSSPATQKKKVRFSMKRNLLMQIGGAVPPENIRTPPDSRPKVQA